MATEDDLRMFPGARIDGEDREPMLEWIVMQLLKQQRNYQTKLREVTFAGVNATARQSVS